MSYPSLSYRSDWISCSPAQPAPMSRLTMSSATLTPPCRACRGGVVSPFPFTMAFQPIINVVAGTVFAYEALVRGTDGESAGEVLGWLNSANVYAFDQSCRVKAIELAAGLGLVETGAALSINFLPGAVYDPAACIRLTLETARKMNFPVDRLVFEVMEREKVIDTQHLKAIAAEYRRRGMRVALDDFGAGFCGLNLLAELDVDVVKLDTRLIREVHLRPKAVAIVETMAALSARIGFELVAEGVETIEEYRMLRACGVNLMQGHLLARPAIEQLPDFALPSAV